MAHNFLPLPLLLKICRDARLKIHYYNVSHITSSDNNQCCHATEELTQTALPLNPKCCASWVVNLQITFNITLITCHPTYNTNNTLQNYQTVLGPGLPPVRPLFIPD